ncbi:hypothetical protein OF829_10465 [Sphingomonas sp. LB-2]|uniref:HD domain-containing protein n=1 Tax=Sphingomonas caeni TaxID=2984949 RepID=UPI00223171A5|nr:hypothetical protein [Sphingomonas caeni]MCW3847666.1 hypothetical protein [Sphingomonas caeni]
MTTQPVSTLVGDMPPPLRALLVERFTVSPLAYHNRDHITAMLEAMAASFSGLGEREARILRYAIWLHDIVYDATATDNERRSADIALELLDWPEDELRAIETCIMATKGHAADDALAQILVDLDLAILAADRADYRRYALAIRDEYRIYPDAQYRAGRARVLEHLSAAPLLRVLSRARGLAYDALEQQARANMRWECEALGGNAPTVQAALGG